VLCGRGTLVNAKFDTGFPPTADQYEVVLLDRSCSIGDPGSAKVRIASALDVRTEGSQHRG
jgi:hypothetical protein